jgi:hypothetical protein
MDDLYNHPPPNTDYHYVLEIQVDIKSEVTNKCEAR